MSIDKEVFSLKCAKYLIFKAKLTLWKKFSSSICESCGASSALFFTAVVTKKWLANFDQEVLICIDIISKNVTTALQEVLRSKKA